MRTFITFLSLLIVAGSTTPAFAQESQRTEIVMGRMSYKLVRGVTNAATCFIELPKQIYLASRDRGTVGIVTGPLTGIGMTIYRAFAGAAETALFLVPQPGYYDPMINPDFVWKGWEEIRPELSKPKESETAEATDGGKEK